MNREIKFRVWDIGCRMFLSLEDIKDGLMDYYVPNLQMFHVMQYTGLKDKNGREIYEGDIVASNNGMLGYDEHLVISWNDRGYWTWFEWIRNNPNVAVLGNIYENPELLGETKNV